MNKLCIPLLFVLIPLLIPTLLFANGGDQRVVEGTYLINLSRAPFTPRVGVKTSMLASFFDIQKNKLIAEDLIVKARIAKLGGERSKRQFVFEQDNIAVEGGVLELSYTFTDAGLHEIFFDFAFSSHPEKVYEAPDFLIDVQRSPKYGAKPIIGGALGGFAFGLIAGWLIKSKYRFLF